jgi:threonylcarbamoyladenosine tRNA methylthiotransferase MtaB
MSTGREIKPGRKMRGPDMSCVRAAFHTLGCKTNHYETDALRQQFASAGFTVVPFDEYAEVYLINTCTVTGEAGRKSRQMLHRARRANPDAILVALGCYSELEKFLTDVDVIIGTGGKQNALAQVCDLLRARGCHYFPGPGLCATGRAADSGTAYEEYGSVFQQSETRAYVKVEDGCNNFCSYCVIPLTRGRVRSRDAEAALNEVEALAGAGYHEIVLTGIHICSYGADRGQPGWTIMELAGQMAAVDGIERIRLGSLEPRSITDEFVALAKKNPCLLPHFHLSLQSGSDAILKRMHRRYTTGEYREVVGKLRAAFPDPGLTTDVIVGFPGETEQEHQESLAFCREIGFSRLHVFRYSKREGTLAATFPGQVDKKTMIRRSQAMIELSDALALTYHRRQIGKQQKVLLEQSGPDGLMTGYSPEYVPVRVASNPNLLAGQIVSVTGIRATSEFLFCQ